jgi:hypothetical protein
MLDKAVKVEMANDKIINDRNMKKAELRKEYRQK